MSLPDEPLDPGLHAELRRRYGTDTPRETLEDEMVEALHREGLLAAVSPLRATRRRLAAAVAAILLFAGGYALGTLPAAPPGSPADTGQYLLLLHEPVGKPITDPGGDAVLVREYSEWARERARAGELVAGEKLAATRAVIGAEADSELQAGTTISGLFIVRAADLAAARAIAESCPHVRRGGTIEVRPIEPT